MKTSPTGYISSYAFRTESIGPSVEIISQNRMFFYQIARSLSIVLHIYHAAKIMGAVR
jgi:hypothetical protein